jgi:preprotein translocase subunit YajC
MNLLTILLQQQQGSSWSGMLMIIAMVVVFYFFMIRPQSKKQKDLKKAREAMQSGDKVITAGGIYGTIRNVNEAEGSMKIEIAPQVVIKVSREQVFPIVTEAPKAEKK